MFMLASALNRCQSSGARSYPVSMASDGSMYTYMERVALILAWIEALTPYSLPNMPALRMRWYSAPSPPISSKRR